MVSKQTEKGQTPLNDFWAAVSVLRRGLHHKTFQKRLKETFRDSEAECMDTFNAESVAAVKEVYKKADPGFCRDIAVAYDGTWHKCRHTSHIGVGAGFEYYMGLLFNAVVLLNQCFGCQMGPKPGDEEYDSWLKKHVHQKNTDVKSGRMEVRAASILLMCSVSKRNQHCTTLVSDGNSATYSALAEENVYRLVHVAKKERLNHIQKRM